MIKKVLVTAATAALLAGQTAAATAAPARASSPVAVAEEGGFGFNAANGPFLFLFFVTAIAFTVMAIDGDDEVPFPTSP